MTSTISRKLRLITRIRHKSNATDGGRSIWQTGIEKDSSQADHDDNEQDQDTIEEEVPTPPPAGWFIIILLDMSRQQLLMKKIEFSGWDRILSIELKAI